MKIRDLDLDQYVIVYDIGKSEHSEGMTVVGRVEEIVFNDDNDNVATINSLGNLYEITDNDEFELWSKSIEGKTESVGTTIKRNDNGNLEVKDSYEIKVPDDILNNNSNLIGYVEDEINTHKSNDVQQRKRNDEEVGLFKIKDLKVGYKVKVLGDNMTGEVTEIADNGKSAEIQVDDGVYRVINDNYDFTIIEWNAVPEYAEDIVNHPSHYNYGDIEVINFIEQVTKHYNPNVAYHIGNAIKYLARSPHKNGKEDIDKARWYIERAFENWDVN
ncbi:DUF3310 domain-containing protein [Staphylococcus saprophyticus]|uniref:DUF3310 domain-containing protein n=1 Tax=Staphylococcus saprophyticus TaxID=29385 RepID=UPI002DB7B603|nr:DUF3310 domain-containing protein [Staphylococcus saprophyticus]MEB7998896.1 DUF3310 domain-containing protein [Staphylococcus saprophyticus]